MTGRHGRAIFALALAVGLAGCGSGDKSPDLMNIRKGQTSPDEFAIIPSKPIEIPADLAALPAPTPGAGNRTDQNPQADAIAALGGNPDRIVLTGVTRGDGALINTATRFGTSATIRQDLAATDLAFRQNNQGRVLERLFNVTRYYKVYAPQSLDQHLELERFRRAGIRTVAAPPLPPEQ